MAMKEKILLVCQRYGPEVNGGAEVYCRDYAERLSRWYDVEVLTSCARDYISWANVYSPGTEEIDGVTVRRFPSVRTRGKDFYALSNRVQRAHSAADEEAWVDAQGPVCPGIPAFLAEHGRDYKAVLFMTYLYYTTVRGMRCDCRRKILIPTAHDEWPIYLSVYDRVFSEADALVFNARAEQRFVCRRFPAAAQKPFALSGVGVEAPEGSLPDVAERFGLTQPYVCYCGRIDTAKGCDTLFRYYLAYRERHPDAPSLALTGRSVIEIPRSQHIRALGFVSEEEKFAVMKNARFFVLPSAHESLSIVTLESMMMGRPVLVNGRCEVLRDHCLDSGAGLYYTNYYEFESCFTRLERDTQTYEAMCRNGQAYVRERYTWDRVMNEVRKLIEEEDL